MAQKTLKCSYCRRTVRLSRWCKEWQEKFVEARLCFDCKFWLEAKEDPNSLVYNGVAYSVQPDLDDNNPGFRGFGGREFIITKDGKTFRSRNVWCRGRIPPEMRKELPDNGTIEYAPIDELSFD